MEAPLGTVKSRLWNPSGTLLVLAEGVPAGLLVSGLQEARFVEYSPITAKELASEFVRTKAERVTTPPVEERTGRTEEAEGLIAPPIAYFPRSSEVKG